MNQIFIYYVMPEIYCFVFALIVLLRVDRNVGSEHEVRELRNLIFTYFAYILTDALWASFELGIFRPGHYINAAINCISVMSISLGCFYWYSFVCDRLHRKYSNRKLHKLLSRLPVAIIFALDIISIYTGWMFRINADGHYCDTKLFIIQGIVNFGYILVPAFLSIKAFIRSNSVTERLEYASYCVYVVISVFSLVFDEDMKYGPILAENMFLAILILFLMIENMHICIDALTSLNNRRRLNCYLEEKLQHASDQHAVIVFMMDINSFKSINDHYGHIAGDEALKIFSGVLKSIAGQSGAFIARYGGDEFCLVAELEDHSAENYDAELREKLANRLKAVKDSTHGQCLSVSVGYTVCYSHQDYQAVFASADRMLYTRKKEWKKNNSK